ncbi:restriction endonuclease subunit S [Streptomyces sp. NPDC053720]|uniref:restriction endonuclease subunit S n=1 Tax=Streptomyces sp. NPDC053720 TaxID=3154855 RepID=UPI003418B71A
MSASRVEDGGGVGRAGLPEGWAWATLDDLTEVVGGVTKDSKRQSDPALPGVPYLRVANVQRMWLDLAEVTTIRVPAEAVERYRLQPGDVLMTEGGDRDKLGRGWIWEGQIDTCIHQNHVFRARITGSSIEPKLLALYLNSVARPWIEANAKQSVNLASISISKIKQLPIPVPPTAEQHRIATALDTRMAGLYAIESKLRVTLDHVDRTWAAVLDAVATGRMPGVATSTPVDRPVETVAEVRGGIQKQSRRRPADNPYPFLRVANVGRGTLDLTDVHEVELFGGEIDRYRLEDGDLLVVEGNGSADQIGRAAIWRSEIKDCVHQNHLIRVRHGADLLPEYLEFVWNSPTMSRRLQKASVSTSGLYTLSTRKLKELELPVATREDQAALVTAAQIARSHLEQARDAAASALGHITALRNTLLTEAFSGRLVPQDAEDEPAEELLKRIRVEREVAEAERKAARKAARAGRKDKAETTAPPPARPDDTILTDGEQTTLPLEFNS